MRKSPSNCPQGAAAVRELSVKLGSYEDPTVTRRWCSRWSSTARKPSGVRSGDFFGTGIGLNPFQGWYRTVGRGRNDDLPLGDALPRVWQDLHRESGRQAGGGSVGSNDGRLDLG